MAYEGFQHLAGQTQQGDQAQPQLFKADVALLLAGNQLLQEEIFGPATIVIEVKDKAQLIQALSSMNGQLTAALIADEADFSEFADVIPVLEEKAGRLLLNGYPTGVEVCEAMVHGGPYPATSDARGTSVGTLAIDRYLRPVCYQNYPQSLLPEALKDENPFNILRLVNGDMTRNKI
jgi:NADP-dependent aldehyde dehydrogenase